MQELLQPTSSLLSPQSLLRSHWSYAGMQVPFEQVNWVERQAAKRSPGGIIISTSASEKLGLVKEHFNYYFAVVWARRPRWLESNVNINVISTQINCHKYTQIRSCNTINLTCGNKTACTMQAQVDRLWNSPIIELETWSQYL